jgi:hypothetical protein
MPCEICGTNANRNYTHSRHPYHKKMLMIKMKKIKEESIKKYGYFKWIE